MENLLDTISLDVVLGYAMRVIGVLLFIFIAWMIAGILGRATTRSLSKTRLDVTLTKFFGNLMKYAVLLLAFIACLSIFGIETTSFAAVLAAAGFAVGLAFQGTLSNFAAGIMLLTFRPFRVGDYVKVGGEAGVVNEIDLFTTVLDTMDNRRIILPNSNVFGSTIENVTHHPTRRVDVSVGTEYSADLKQARSVMLETVTGMDGVLSDPAPRVYLVELGDSSINWSVRVWANTADYWNIREKVTQAVKYGLDEAGIGIPFPQLDVHMADS